MLAVLLLFVNRAKRELKIFLFCGFSGALAEAFAVFFGPWSYANPDFIGVPFWLFILWGIASVFIVRVYLFFKD